MNVLMSGGVKTDNILEVIKARFSSGVDFTVEKNISNINNYFSRGNYFDRAIIMEQSWTGDDTIKDEIEIRENLHKFITEVRERLKSYEILFVVTSDERMAKIVLEESFDILAYSKVILKNPPFYASFFTDLVAKDIGDIPDKYLFDIAKTSRQDEPDNMDNIAWSHGKGDSNQGLETGLEGKLLGSTDSLGSYEDEYGDGIDGYGEYGDEYGDDSSEEEINEVEDDDDGFDSIVDNFNGLGDFDDLGGGGSFGGFDTLSEYNDINDTSFDGVDNGLDTFDGVDNGLDVSDEFDVDIEDDFGDGLMEDENIGLFNGDSGFDLPIPVENKKEHSDISSKAEVYFDDKYYDDNKGSKVDKSNDVPLDAGTVFKGIKGKRAKSRGRTNINSGNNKSNPNLDVEDLKIVLNTFLKRGNSLTVTGGRCSGKTVVASNIANIITNLGYTVLLVDMDTKWRGQSYVTKDVYDTVHTGDVAKASLRKAINSNSPDIGRYVDIVRPGFHVLTTALGCDMEDVGEVIQSMKLSRFINNAKSSYNFIVFDVPFDDLTTSLADVLFASDDLIMCVEATNHGLMECLLNMGNIDSSDVKNMMFNISQVVFNKVSKIEKAFGYPVKTVRDLLGAMDKQMMELIGGEAEYSFGSLKVSGILKYSPLYDKYCFNKQQVSDFEDGERIFTEIIKKVIVKN